MEAGEPETGTPESKAPTPGDEDVRPASGDEGARLDEQSAQTGAGSAGATSSPLNRRRLRAGVIAVAIVVAVVAWVATRSGGGSSEQASPEPAPPRIVTEVELAEAAASLGRPIYWAGPVAGKELELNELGEGGVQVRYLPEGTEAGTGAAKSLTVGSYPLSDPSGAIETVAKQPNELVRRLPDGRQVVAGEQSPTNVYFASLDNSVEVEVYDPSAKRAMQLVMSGRVQPVS